MSAKPGFTILKPGFHTLIEDSGRVGCYRLGLSQGGPADRLSFWWANRLCGNRANTSALEITCGGLEFYTNADIQIALTGAEAELVINDSSARNWQSHNIPAGSTVRIGPTTNGMRCYLAVRNGINTPPVFNSTATVTREGLGGIAGCALQPGDFLPIFPCNDEPSFFLPEQDRPRFYARNALEQPQQLRVIPGWQSRELSRRLKRAFFTTEFSLSAKSDRMGGRLEGAQLAVDTPEGLPGNMVSEGILPGSIQIPPDGSPIIMLCDHQTIGGYPKIGTVISPDLWRLAQLPPGSILRFAPITLGKAQQRYRQLVKSYESTSPRRID